MTKPLFVDTTGLHDAADVLRKLRLPDPPLPLGSSGTDGVAAAITTTMPGIESAVLEGLPAVAGALARTAGSMAAAAQLYTETDGILGTTIAEGGQLTDPADPVGASAVESRGAMWASGSPAGAPATAVGASIAPNAIAMPEALAAVPGTVTEAAAQLNPTVSAVGSVTQSIVSSAQGAARTPPPGIDGESEDRDDTAESGHRAESDAEAVPAAAPMDTTSADIATPNPAMVQR